MEKAQYSKDPVKVALRILAGIIAREAVKDRLAKIDCLDSYPLPQRSLEGEGRRIQKTAGLALTNRGPIEDDRNTAPHDQHRICHTLLNSGVSSDVRTKLEKPP
jgi:hypothetical protein